MKSVVGLALVAGAIAAETQSYWGDVPVDPTTKATTTTTETWSDYDPPAPTTTTEATWSDYDPSESTVVEETETWSDVDFETVTVTYTKKDHVVVTKTITKPVDPTAVHTWEDVVSSAVADPTTYWSDAPVADTTAPVSPASTWVDAVIGECSVVTKTVTASTYIWVPAPADPTEWEETSVAPTSADPTWSDYPVDPTTTAVESTWSDYPVDPTTTTVADSTWSDYTVAPTTTPVAPTTTKGWTTSTTKPHTTTTTSAAPKPTAAKCPNDGGKTLASGGSCGGSFAINCNVKASPGAGSKFWQKTKGEKIPTLAGCIAICNENTLCESVLYVQSAGSADDQLCWQTSGLGPVTGEGYAQIAYKTGAKGKCSASYNA